MRFASFKDCFSANLRIHDQTNKKQGLTAESGFWQLTLITNHSTEILQDSRFTLTNRKKGMQRKLQIHNNKLGSRENQDFVLQSLPVRKEWGEHTPKKKNSYLKPKNM